MPYSIGGYKIPGHWETLYKADGFDTQYDTQVWVDEHGNRTDKTRKVLSTRNKPHVERKRWWED